MKISVRSLPGMAATLCATALPLAVSATNSAAQQAATGTDLAIVNVTVVPMDRERVLRDQTVVVRDGRIVEMGPSSEVGVPRGAQVIEGQGRYLMPGLVDMHIHVVGGTGAPGDGAWQQMMLMVANGVTTARSLAGAPTAPTVRDAIASGALVGPRLYLAGSSLNHNSVTTPEGARAAVREQKAAGFDFIKTHGVSSEVYDAIVETAREEGIRLVGHVTPDYGLERALAAGQQIEHLDGYLAATMPADASVAAPPGQVFFGPELDHMRISAMPELARRTAAADVWNSPTLALFEIIAEPRTPDHYLALPEMRYVPENARKAWAGQIAQVAAAPATPEQRARYTELRRAMTRALVEAGALIMAGSDSPQFFMAPGFSLHNEIEALQRAGLTPFQALQAATSNPARYIGDSAEFGRVAEGMEADLLLLDADPLADVANTRRIHGVVLDGRWLSEEDLVALKDSVAAFTNAAPQSGATPGTPEISASVANLIRRMHAQYSDTWYSTLSFRQRVIRTPPEGAAPPAEIWFERAAHPGRLRIDFGNEYSGNGALFARDSTYMFRDGELVQKNPRTNPLMILGFDIYRQDPARTEAQLRAEGFDLSKLGVAEFDGRPVYVVGAESGDLTRPQFWIDQERLLFVRMITPHPQDSTRYSEIIFDEYEPLAGGWIAPLVIFRTDGVETMREEYFDIVANPDLPAEIFDPARWQAGR